MTFLRKLLAKYRSIAYLLLNRSKRGITYTATAPCHLIASSSLIMYGGDAVHPCVRYVPERIYGHKWWMVYTPYYSANAKIENPRLCYGESETSEAPTKWHVVKELVPQHEHGYNSDPYLLIEGGKMFVFWRENDTPVLRDKHLVRGTFCAEVNKDFNLLNQKLVLPEGAQFEDKETCPAFAQDGNSYVGYAMHLKFKNNFMHTVAPKSICRLFDKAAAVSDVLGIYSQQKFRGVAVWQSPNLEREFSYIKSLPIYNKNRLYRPWHMDIFDWDGNRYMVIQTNQSNADICLAVQTEKGFKVFPKPLLTNADIGKVGIYKPTALVVDGIFYLYYTAQDPKHRSLNQLYLKQLPFSEVLASIN